MTRLARRAGIAGAVALVRRAGSVGALALVFALTPGLAHAHLVDTRLGDFYSGALHPLTDFEQVLPWLALAVLAAFQGPRTARWVVLAFPLALAAGGALSLVLPPPPFAPVAGVTLVALTGLAVAAQLRLPLAALLVLAVGLGLLDGYQNGAAMVATTDRFLFLSGVTVIGYAFVTLALGCAIAFLAGVGGWRPIALRAAGSWVAAVGIMVLGLHLVSRGVG
ncbi:HupE/UreJ family protein [Xanthobacter aminoxidans]|uniref:HupE/UreJ family protein n=1 Tax=Xanthobacter aminoxidans TaxID=186280 RepID=UPI002022FD19|nr:HupE/UreJ family protein [Xanthobacter aminoxidans]MCL8384918.1 HupE/UreJ family protein [Xanthobacter aminoxidans]